MHKEDGHRDEVLHSNSKRLKPEPKLLQALLDNRELHQPMRMLSWATSPIRRTRAPKFNPGLTVPVPSHRKRYQHILTFASDMPLVSCNATA